MTDYQTWRARGWRRYLPAVRLVVALLALGLILALLF